MVMASLTLGVRYGGVVLLHVSITTTCLVLILTYRQGVFGEILNATAYAFAPAILVTPLGALVY